MMANGSTARRGSSPLAYHQASPPKHQRIGDAVDDGVEVRTALAGRSEALASAPSSRSGRAARITRRSPRWNVPAPTATAAPTPISRPMIREVVRRETGLAQPVTEGLHGLLDRGAESSVEHRDEAIRAGPEGRATAVAVVMTTARAGRATVGAAGGRRRPPASDRMEGVAVKSYPAEKVRNVVLVGHGGAGKTSVAEHCWHEQERSREQVGWTTARASSTPTPSR